MARVDVAIEPSDILDFAEIFLGDSPVEKKIEGMLQVNGFTPATPSQMESLTPKRREIWRQERERVASERFHNDPVALVEIAYANGPNTITIPLHIQLPVKQMVKQAISEGFTMTSAITGETTKLPYTVETCMQYYQFTVAIHRPLIVTIDL
jgi:hypothetical protein